MTTIAYRAGVLAADTAMNCGGVRVSRSRKVGQSRHGLAAACGASAFGQAFLAWVAGGGALDPRSPDRPKPGDNDEGVLIRPDGSIVVYEDAGALDIDAPYYAAGSGYAIALGAMHAGASAEEAVRAAIAHDVYSGGEVESVRLPVAGDKAAQAAVEGRVRVGYGAEAVISSPLGLRPATVQDRRDDYGP